MDEAVQQEQARLQQEQERESIIQKICAPDALERLKRVKMVKKELVDKVETFLCQQAKSGKLRSQVTEAQVIELLASIGGAQQEQKITIARKRYANDDDDDEDDDSDLK